MRPAGAALLALVLVGCGGSPPDGGPLDDGRAPGLIEVYEVAEQAPGHDGALGWTDWSDPTVARVYLLERVGGPTLTIAVHELLHAMGLHEHEAGEDCWLHAVPDPTLATEDPPHLCAAELSRLSTTAIPTVVRILDADVRPVVDSAANFLNGQLGRQAYLLAP